ncbi:MAG: LysM peptidoglycan-binding domain-containing protein, partial [Litorilinea sp.]
MAKHSKARITLVGIFLLSFVLAGVAFWRTDLHTAWAGDSFPTVEIDGELFYIVRSGDSADALAEAFGVGVDELLDANELEAGVDLRIGQRLRVPATSDLYLRPADAEIITEDATEDADEEAAGEAGEDEESDGESTASRAAVVAPPVDDDVYIVRRGDSLQLIAQNTGVSVEDLVAFNNLTRAYPLYRGQELRLTRPSEEETEPENGMEETAPTARQYTVLRGDSLQIIARQFNISVEDLVAANDLGGRAYLYQGQILTIPAPESVFLAPSAASDSNASETDTDTDTGSGNAMEEDADTSGLESGEGTKG